VIYCFKVAVYCVSVGGLRVSVRYHSLSCPSNLRGEERRGGRERREGEREREREGGRISVAFICVCFYDVLLT